MAYGLLSVASLVLSPVVQRLFWLGPYLHALMGPPAWLLWGWTGVPFFLVGTFIVFGATTWVLVFFDRRAVQQIGFSVVGLLWLALGTLAWDPWP